MQLHASTTRIPAIPVLLALLALACTAATATADNVLARDIRLAVDGTPCGVSIARVTLEGAGTVNPADTAGAAEQPEGGVTRTRLLSGEQGNVVAYLADAESRFSLEVSGQTGEVVLHVVGVNRLVCKQGMGFIVAGLHPGSGEMDLADETVILQNTGDQHGLSISAAHMRIVATADGARVVIPLSPETRTVAVLPFVGDAMIAWERADRRAAGPAPVTIAQIARARQQGGAGMNITDLQERPRPIGEWEWWTGTERLLKPLLADPREARVRLGLGYGNDSRKFFEAGIGGDITIVRNQLAEDRAVSIGARGLIVGRLETCEESFPLLNTDFIIGVTGAYQLGDDTFEAFLYHESSHLGDEILENGERARRDYSREAIRLLWSHEFGQVGPGELRVYAGPTFNIRAYPSDLYGVILQAGAEYRWMAWNRWMYAAVDLQSKQENDFSVNFTGQVGVELGDPAKVRNRPRVFLEFFNGNSVMGQYWNEYETYVMLGFGYDF